MDKTEPHTWLEHLRIFQYPLTALYQHRRQSRNPLVQRDDRGMSYSTTPGYDRVPMQPQSSSCIQLHNININQLVITSSVLVWCGSINP